jgi:hypothetical protein
LCFALKIKSLKVCSRKLINKFFTPKYTAIGRSVSGNKTTDNTIKSWLMTKTESEEDFGIVIPIGRKRKVYW